MTFDQVKKMTVAYIGMTAKRGSRDENGLYTAIKCDPCVVLMSNKHGVKPCLVSSIDCERAEWSDLRGMRARKHDWEAGKDLVFLAKRHGWRIKADASLFVKAYIVYLKGLKAEKRSKNHDKILAEVQETLAAIQ